MKRAVLGACVVCVFALQAQAAESVADPVIEGRPASEWIYRLSESDRSDEAIRTLVRAGRFAVPPLCDAMKQYFATDSEFRQNGTRALVEIGGDAVPVLKSYVSDRNSGPDALAVLWLIEKDPKWIRQLLLHDGSRYDALKTTAPTDRDVLLSLLKDSEATVRAGAVDALSLRLDQSVETAIVQSLEDSDAGVRRKSAFALARSSSAESMKALLPRLQDDDVGVRYAAAETLVRSKALAESDREALAPALMDLARKATNGESFRTFELIRATPFCNRVLATLLEDPDARVRRGAAGTLLRLSNNAILEDANGRRELLDLLVKGSGDTEERVRSFCSLAVRVLLKKSAVSPTELVEALKRSPNVAKNTLALGTHANLFPFAAELSPHLEGAWNREMTPLARAQLAEMLWTAAKRPEAIEYVESTLRQPSLSIPSYGYTLVFRKAAQPMLLKAARDKDAGVVERVGPLFDEEFVKSLDARTLVELLRESGAPVRYRVAQHVGSVPDPAHELFEAIVDKLASDPSADVRAGAAWSLARLTKSNATAPPALLAALRDRNETVRAVALWSLAQNRPAESNDLFTAALEDPNPVVRSTALRALAGSLKKDAVPILRDGLNDTSADVRTVAAGKLQSLAEESIPDLKKLLSVESFSIRSDAASRLWKLSSDPEVVPALAQWLMQDKSHRREILGLLDQTGPHGTVAISELSSVLTEDEDSWNRHYAAKILRKLGSAASKAVPSLVKATKDSSPDVRAEAAWALWTIERHKDALPTLTALIVEGKGRPDSVHGAIREMEAEARSSLPALRAAALRESHFTQKEHLRRLVREIETAAAKAQKQS